jgi:hypothetical protein
MEQWSKQLGAWLMVRSPHAAPQAASVYPASLYPAPAFPDLGDPAERRRLTPAALRAFFSIMRCWSVRDEDARILLGGVSNGTFYTWKQGTARQLEADRLLRISYLIGIFKALNILFSLELADTWVSLPNTNELFGGRAPLDTMLRGGAPAMDMVRRLLDARRGG